MPESRFVRKRRKVKESRWKERRAEMVIGEIAKAALTVCIYYQLLC